MSSVGKKERKEQKIKEIEEERKKEEKKVEEGGPACIGLQRSNNKRFDGSESELVCAPRGRSPLILWLFYA